MPYKDDESLPALIRGISCVGVGRNGSCGCSSAIIDAIAKVLKQGDYDRAQWGAFVGALWIKTPTELELYFENLLGLPILTDAQACIDAYMQDDPLVVQKYAKVLMHGGDLTYVQSKELGLSFFGSTLSPFSAGFFASAFRVKYETEAEFTGLLSALQEDFLVMPRPTGTLLAFSEPHDGAVRSFIITPHLQRYFMTKGFATVALCSDSAGPKYGANLKAVARALGAPFLGKDWGAGNSVEGWGQYIDQDEYCPSASFWRSIRRSIVKRPFLATLEKVLNPLKADILITSAFHAPYAQKMIDIASGNGFRGIISTFKSVEGGLCLSLARQTTLLLARKRDGIWEQTEMLFTPADFVMTQESDLKNISPTVEENVKALQEYRRGNDSHYARSIEYTTAVYEKALDWIDEKNHP